MANISEEEVLKIVEQRLKDALEGEDPKVAQATINYVFAQFNEASRLGIVSESEFQRIILKACKGLNSLLFSVNFTRNLQRRQVTYIAVSNLIRVVFSRFLNGNDRQYDLSKFAAMNPPKISVGRGD